MAHSPGRSSSETPPAESAPGETVESAGRLEALDDTNLLGSKAEDAFDRFTRLAAQLLGTETAFISLVEGDGQFYKSTFGFPAPSGEQQANEDSATLAFCQRVVEEGESIAAGGASSQEASGPSYAGAPLRTSEGHVLGCFCVTDAAPRTWDEGALQLLEDLAAATMARIELKQARQESETIRRQAQAAEQEAQEAQKIAEAARQEAEAAQRRAEEAQREAEEASAAKSRFVANMSHELRTPLNAVIGYSDMLRDDPASYDEERLAQGLNRIHDGGHQLLTLVNDVLDLSKAEAGRLRVSKTTFAFAPLVEQVTDVVYPTLEANGNTLDVEGAPEDIGKICTDESKLRQILSNLLSNAAKYTEDGAVTLAVQLRNRSSPDGSGDGSGDGTPGENIAAGEKDEAACPPGMAPRELVIEVRDTGVGMAAEEQESIFEAFERSEETADIRGTGLGLGIVQNFCSLMGGHVSVTSEKGAGSSFTVRLPIRQAEEETAGDGNAAEEAGGAPGGVLPEESGTLPPQKENLVLVIDDDRDARVLLRNHLREAGFDVETASTGAEGIEQAHELHPMAITLDVLMEDLNGWEVLNHLKREDSALRHIPVIMVTITPSAGHAFRLGASDHVVKPVSKERLVELLGAYRREGPPLKVLVIDDEEATRDRVRGAIEGHAEGHEVREAGSGQEAFDVIDEGFAPDLVLLDLLLPETDPFALLESLRERPGVAAAAVVALTDEVLSPEEVRRLNERVEGVIQKTTYTREDLLEAVQGRMKQLYQGEEEPPAPASA